MASPCHTCLFMIASCLAPACRTAHGEKSQNSAVLCSVEFLVSMVGWHAQLVPVMRWEHTKTGCCSSMRA